MRMADRSPGTVKFPDIFSGFSGHAITVSSTTGSSPPFRKVRHSESRHSWSLHGTVLDIATTRRLTLTITLTLTVS